VIRKVIQEKLKQLRGDLTQEEFAKKLGVSKSLYEKLERGERDLSKRTLKKLKNLFPTLDVNIFFE
jgi:transcriptional regulator with XRE-family HTH domain